MIWFLMYGCSSKIFDSAAVMEESSVYVIDELLFARRSDEGTWGFDIDGRSSSHVDSQGCFHEDLVDPMGNDGIDNALSGIVPALELTEAAAIEPLIDAAIRDGSLQFILEIEESEVIIHRGIGAAMVGTDGKILDSQSFVVEPEPLQILSFFSDQDTLLALGLEFPLRLSVMGEDIQMDMYQGGLRWSKQEDGTLFGVLGGGIPTENLIELVEIEEVGPNELFRGFVESTADLFPDASGKCQFFSAGFVFHAIPAFLIAD